MSASRVTLPQLKMISNQYAEQKKTFYFFLPSVLRFCPVYCPHPLGAPFYPNLLRKKRCMHTLFPVFFLAKGQFLIIAERWHITIYHCSILMSPGRGSLMIFDDHQQLQLAGDSVRIKMNIKALLCFYISGNSFKYFFLSWSLVVVLPLILWGLLKLKHTKSGDN